MADTPNAIPAPPPGFTPVPDQSAGAVPPPPPGFKPVESAVGNPAFDLTAPRATGGQGPLGVASGIGAGVFETIQGGKELINKVLPNSLQIPDVPANLRTENTPSENLGGMLESGLEYATGEEVLDVLGRVAKVDQLLKSSPTVAKMVMAHPQLMKSIAKIGKQTVVGGAQGAVKGAAEGDAKGGAEGGALGSLVGSTVAEVGGAGIPAVAKKVGLMTDDVEDVMRAAKPGKRNEKFLADWDIAKERYAKEMDANGQYEDLNDAAERMRDQRQEFWKTEVKPEIDARLQKAVFPMPPAQPGQTQFKFTNPISDAVRAKASPAMQRLSPKSAKAIETIAKRFDGPMTVQELEENIEHLNAELTTEGFYKMSASERAAAVKANPSLAAKSAAVEASRDQLYTFLEKDGAPNMQEKKRTYGAMRNVENEVRGQVNVASRQNPISLKQIIAIASGHPVGIAATLADKIYNDPAAILNRAVRKSAPDGAITAAAKDLVSGAGTVIKKATPAAGAGVGRMVFVGGDGRKYLGDPAKWDQIQQADPGAKQVQSDSAAPAQ